MKENMIMSIKPEWCELIFSGKKTIEFRKRFNPLFSGRVYAYRSRDVKKIMGFFDVVEAIPFNINDCDAWRLMKSGCIEKHDLGKYLNRGQFPGEGYALVIENVTPFQFPQSLSSIGIERPPQSYQYIHGIKAIALFCSGIDFSLSPSDGFDPF